MQWQPVNYIIFWLKLGFFQKSYQWILLTNGLTFSMMVILQRVPCCPVNSIIRTRWQPCNHQIKCLSVMEDSQKELITWPTGRQDAQLLLWHATLWGVFPPLGHDLEPLQKVHAVAAAWASPWTFSRFCKVNIPLWTPFQSVLRCTASSWHGVMLSRWFSPYLAVRRGEIEYDGYLLGFAVIQNKGGSDGNLARSSRERWCCRIYCKYCNMFGFITLQQSLGMHAHSHKKVYRWFSRAMTVV